MTNQFSEKISEILAYSREEAIRLANRCVAPEHLLLGMMRLRESTTNSLFHRLGIDSQSVKEKLEELARNEKVAISEEQSDIILTPQANNILKLAVLEARFGHSQQVEEEHLLLAIMHDAANNGAKQILESNNMNYEEIRSLLHVTNGVGLPEEEFEEEQKKANSSNQSNGNTTTTQQDKQKSKTPMLDNFSTDLTLQARNNKLDEVVGREKEMMRVDRKSVV